MEKSNHQDLIQWDEELQTNINKGFCSPDDVLNLCGEQVVHARPPQSSGGEENTSLQLSGMEGVSGGTTCLLEHEQSLDGIPPQLRTLAGSRHGVEFDSQFPDPPSYKPASPLEPQVQKEPIQSDPRPVGAKLGPAPTHPLLTENLMAAPNHCSQPSSFNTCLPENILDGINLNLSEVGGKGLLTTYMHEEQDMHTLSSVRGPSEDGMLYGFDLSCDRDGNQYTALDQMSYEYDVTCGEEVQYTSLDPVSYSFDVSCETEEDISTSVDPMSYEFEVACARDDDGMVCFHQSPVDGGKGDAAMSSEGGGEATSALCSWPETQLAMEPLEHQSSTESSSLDTPVRNEGSSKTTAMASQEQESPVKEAHRTEQALTSENTAAEMKRSPESDETTTVHYLHYLSISRDKETSGSGMDECFSEQHMGGSVEPANTSVASYTPSLCRAASWDRTAAAADGCLENPSQPTGEISAEDGLDSSVAASAPLLSKRCPALAADPPGLSISGNTDGQVVQTTEGETRTIQPALSLFGNEEGKSQGRPASQNGDALMEPILVQREPSISPSREKPPSGEDPDSPTDHSPGDFSLQVSTARGHSIPNSASAKTVSKSAAKTRWAEILGRAGEETRTSSDSDSDGTSTSQKFRPPVNEERTISKGSEETELASLTNTTSKGRDGEQLAVCSDVPEAAQARARQQRENEKQGSGGQHGWGIQELEVGCDATSRETAGSEETLEPRLDPAEKHKASKLQKVDCQRECNQPESASVRDGEELRHTGSSGQPFLYTCTKCSVYFQDKDYLRRHMLDHFDGQSAEGSAGGLGPFSCQECGHSFCDPASLRSHMGLHQARRASFMEAIQELAEPRAKGCGARLQCPHCKFGTNSPARFEDHVKKHARLAPPPCKLCKAQAATASELQEHWLLCHPHSLQERKTPCVPNPRTPPLAATVGLQAGKEHPPAGRDEKGCVKFGRLSPFQRKPGRSAWPSASQGSGQSGKCENSQTFPSGSLPERASLPSAAKGPSRYQAKHPLWRGDAKRKAMLETAGSRGGKFRMHSLVGTAKGSRPHSVPYGSPTDLCQYLGLQDAARAALFPLAEESYNPQKLATDSAPGQQWKELEVGSEGVANLRNALTYRKVIVDHRPAQATSCGPPVPAPSATEVERTCGVSMDPQVKGVEQKVSESAGHVDNARSFHAKKRRQSGALPGASCRPRAVKKHTKELLETINLPLDLPVDQRQQLVKMTPLILLEDMDRQSVSKSTSDDQVFESSSEPLDIRPQNEPVNGLPCEPTETHSIHKPTDDIPQVEPMETHSRCIAGNSHSQHKSIEIRSYELIENRSLCKSFNSYPLHISLENHSHEPSEPHSQHNLVNSHSLLKKTHSRYESICFHSQRDTLSSYSQSHTFPEERELDSSLEAQVDRGLFWEVPGEDLTIDLMKKSKDLLSRNLLRMFPLEERECPYCPDKFHTGIGLANHVRGHLKRVGISYNTRHFVSAEEVTAIEKQFSLQKLKRKALKFRGGVVEKCNFCGASFDSRAGMSSHARAHLRELGVMTWSATSSPIDLLNELLHDQVPPALADGQPSPDPASSGHTSHRPGSDPPNARLPAKVFTSANRNSPPPRNKVVIIDPDDDEMSALVLDLPSGHSSGETELQEKNGFLGALDDNSHPKQCLSKISLVSQGEDSLQSNKLLNSCQLCGTCFETRKGLSSHARFHLRQFGVPDSESSGAPIGTLYELMKRKGIPNVLPSALANDKPQSYAPKDMSGLKQEALGKPLGEECQGETTPTAKSPKLGMNSPPKGQSQTSTLKKVHPILPKPVSSKSPEQGKAGRSLMNTPQTSGELLSKKLFWSPQDDNTPLNLTVDQPSKDVRCEFCGEYFENRKGLSSHARSHLRQFGVTEWTVNGSPIDTLKELMKRKGKLEPFGHDPEQRGLQQDPQNYKYEEKPIAKPFGHIIKSPVKVMHQKHLTPQNRKVLTYTSNSQHPTLSPLGKKIPMGFVSTASLKKSMPDERTMTHELKPSYTESGSYKPKATWSPQEKVTTTPVIAADTCCELCGHYFENRKALASHARAHLRQFGVTEWHINGSPIDTLREWIRQKPNISPGTSVNCVQDRPLPKPIRNNIKSIVKELPGELCSLPGGKTVKLEPVQPKTVELGFPTSPVQKNPETDKMPPNECYTPTDLSQSNITECTPSSSMPSEDEEPHPKKKRKHPVKLGTCEYCGVTLTTGVGLSNHMRGHLKSGLKRKLPSLSQFEELHEKAEPALTDTYNERKQQKPTIYTENLSPKREEGKETKTFRSKSEEPKPLRVRPVIFPVLKPEPLSLVKFIGNIYTLKCRFCDVEFHGPLSIQEEWVRHLQRHILDVNFPKVEAVREEISTSAEPEK
ncbi:uncharacterized protein LOC116991975 isoform X6 [Amblyraja radiata]|uniref:uncharacterized protein LOC116991975 isoform X6 n=1 Tax=Amblyraja radiata TaxID=386614 RepID=UPI00140201CB|nr:uncharacterized protein LOC116991975 isoform X6 [Amblyraja radiata]